MKACLKIECIGDNNTQYLEFWKSATKEVLGRGLAEDVFGKIPARYFVAEITGIDLKYKYKRRFLKGRKDYSHANGVGSRGVYVNYILDSGKIYEVKSPISWKRSERYFCTATNEGEIELLTKEQVDLWLRNH